VSGWNVTGWNMSGWNASSGVTRGSKASSWNVSGWNVTSWNTSCWNITGWNMSGGPEDHLDHLRMNYLLMRRLPLPRLLGQLGEPSNRDLAREERGSLTRLPLNLNPENHLDHLRICLALPRLLGRFGDPSDSNLAREKPRSLPLNLNLDPLPLLGPGGSVSLCDLFALVPFVDPPVADTRYVPTPPTPEPQLFIPPRGSPGLFGPRSPRDSFHE